MTQCEASSDAFTLHADNLHEELRPSMDLYRDGYFDEAVRKASQRFINRIQERSVRPDMHGKSLIEHSFSGQKPLLEFSDRETLSERAEHDGFRHLGVGLALGLRNVLSHEDDYGLTNVSALEWMAFISAMHRRLDDARHVAGQSEGRSATH